MRRILKALLTATLLALLVFQAAGQRLTEQHLMTVVKNVGRTNHPGTALPIIKMVEDAESLELLFVAKPDPTIRVGRGILNLCESYGEYATDALAFVMSHELAHYFGRDDIKNRSVSQSVLEQIADFDGLFMTFKAGYRSMAVAAEVLEELYSQMSLKSDRDYPDLAERVSSIAGTVQSFEQEVFTYQAATFLYYQKHYKAASQLFERLSRLLDVPEVKNSLAASHLNEAIKYLPRQTPFYAYPLEVDPGIRLESRLQRSATTSDKVFKDALSKSVGLLERLVNLSPAYQPAMVNLVVAHYLTGNLDEAEKVLERYNEAITAPANYALMKALLAEAAGDMEQANTWFQKSVEAGDYYAAYNYELFKEDPATRKQMRSGLIRKHLMQPPARTYPGDWKNPGPANFSRLTTLNEDEIVKVSAGIDQELVLKVSFEEGTEYLLFPGFNCTGCDRQAIEERRQEILAYQQRLKPEDYQVAQYSSMDIWLLKSDNLMLFEYEGNLIGWFRYEIN